MREMKLCMSLRSKHAFHGIYPLGPSRPISGTPHPRSHDPPESRSQNVNGHLSELFDDSLLEYIETYDYLY